MRTFLSWLLLPLYLVLTIATLCIWDVFLKIFWRCARPIHKPFLDAGIGLLLVHLRILGTRIRVRFHEELPQHRPLVVVSNHQSVYDIPLLMWYLRKWSPVFVAKKELGKWIPSVSCTLRENGSILIDRNDAAQAIPAIRELGRRIAERRIAACIFPEGTRARNGELRKFKASGVLNLVEHAPNCLVVPVAIDGSWRLVRHGFLPIPWGVEVRVEVLPHLDPQETDAAQLVPLVQERIGQQLLSRS